MKREGGQAGGFFLPLVLVIIAFFAGAYFGHHYYGKVIGWIAGTEEMRAEPARSGSGNSSGSLRKEEILAAIESSRTLPPGKRGEFRTTIEAAYKARREGKITGELLAEWQDAERLFKDGKREGGLSNSELSSVVARFAAIVQKAR